MGIETRILQSREISEWVQSKVDGLSCPKYSTVKRARMAGACWHVAIEHAQAVVLLMEARLHGSALALVRSMWESLVRGMWLAYAASDEAVDRAGKDKFPNLGEQIVELEKPGRLPPGMLSEIKKEQWTRLNSYTHTGFQQIGARLVPGGVGYNYSKEELVWVLQWADMVALSSASSFANLAEDEGLASECLAQMQTCA